jgi:hypothetical protein
MVDNHDCLPYKEQVSKKEYNMLDYVKFFKKDIISGVADAVGDKFVAFFMIGDVNFEVVEVHDGFFFGKAV